MSGWTWTYDPQRGAYDGDGPNGATACVAKDGTGSTPWVAYCAGAETSHSTMREAKAACEERAKA